MWRILADVWIIGTAVLLLAMITAKEDPNQPIRDFCEGREPPRYPAREKATQIAAVIIVAGLLIWLV